MKKILTGIATMALVVSVSSITAFAAGGGRGRNFVDNDNDGVCDYYNNSCQFVDDDGDGICDNCGLGTHGMGARYVDADGDGVCDNYGSNGNGAGYVDADGDGICDNITTGTSQNGSGFRRGRCGGQGRRGR